MRVSRFDIAIVGGKVIDGTGAPWYYADLGIAGDRITAIARTRPGDVSPLATAAAEVIDARGRVVSPGFIDMHSHSDLTLLGNPTADSKVMQGVTTEVIGQCGVSASPISAERAAEVQALLGEDGIAVDWRRFSEYAARVESLGMSVNVAGLVGHGTVRMDAMGFRQAAPTQDELAVMRRLVEEAMDDGAFGFSTGLIYTPGSYSTTDEVVELAKAAARHGGTYFTHMRSESRGLLAATNEAITIGREAGMPVQISHLKCAGAARGRSGELIELLASARAAGIEVTADQYPYTAGATSLAAMLPPWAHVGGQDEMRARLRDPETRRRMRSDMLGTLPGWENDFGSITFADVLIAGCADHALEGKCVQQVADERGQDAHDTMFDILADTDINTGMVVFMMKEEDVRAILAQEIVMIGSDSSGVAPRLGGKPHPRSYGTFVRVLGEYAREQKVISLAQAVHKMTGLPAAKLGLQDRGLLREGFRADIVVFDPGTVIDRATYQDPHQFPAGIAHVMVNGRFTVRDGEHTGSRPGSFLRHA